MSLARQAARRRRPAVGAGLASGSAHTRLSATTDVTTLPHEFRQRRTKRYAAIARTATAKEAPGVP